MSRGPTLAELSHRLETGATTARDLVDECLERIADPAGEGARTFTRVAKTEARAAADGIDKLRKAGVALSPFAGIPVSIKDLFDIKGEVTRAGSIVLKDTPPATADAEAVARLRRAGFVVIGRTNMTEFAFSGVGLNPHYGTPRGPWDRSKKDPKAGRIPGGSSSGAAVSVVDGMAHVGLGTDTGGSCRIPAAFNGIVGYKPTARRVPTIGALPLSTTLDSIGPIARSVACCAAVDAVLAGEQQREVIPADLRGIAIAVPQNLVLGDVDDKVGAAFERALSRLSAAGARVEKLKIPEFDDIPRINAKAGFSAPEALAWHKGHIAKGAAKYDPRVLVRINRGTEQSAIDYIELIAARKRLIDDVAARTRGYAVLAMPTVPFVPPRISDLDKDEDYGRINMLTLRNPSVINMLDGCSISVPMSTGAEPPMGLMLAARTGEDHALFRIAAATEAALRSK